MEQEKKNPAKTMAKSVSLSAIARQFYMKHWGLLLSAVLVLVVIIELWAALAPFVAAFVLAYLLAAPSRWVYLKLRGRVPLPICSIATFLILLLVFSSVSLLFIPVVLTQLELIQNNLPQLIVSLKRTVLPWFNDLFGGSLAIDSEKLEETVAGYISENRSTLTEFTTKVLRAGSQSVVGITGFVSLTVIATLFILPGWTQICRQFKQHFPPRSWQRAQPFFTEIDTVMVEYIKGMMIVMLFLSTFYSIGLSVIGLQSGWAIGLLAGLLCVIPYVGFAIALVVGVLTAALDLQGFLPVFLVLVVFVAGQFLEGFVLTPLVVGDKIGLSALSVIFALAFFGGIFGMVGVFLALPLAAIFKVAYVHAFARYQRSDFYQQA